MEKVVFALEQDADGWPPAAAEGLWAEPLGNGRYRLDNTPWYALGVNNRDVVEAAEGEDGQVWFERVVERSGHATFRVIVSEPEDMQAARDELRALDVESELNERYRLISLDVPESVSLAELQELLDRGKQVGRWDYEEGSVPSERLDAEA